MTGRKNKNASFGSRGGRDRIARKIIPISDKENYNIGDTILLETTPKEFGRIAAQTAKQVIVQKIREAERNVIYKNYIEILDQVKSAKINRISLAQ